MATLASPPDRLAELRTAVGDALIEDAETRHLHSHDVYGQGAEPLAVLRPTDVDTLARGVAAVTDAGLAVLPRGGGMSYTGGYLSDRDTVLVDTTALDRIVVDEAGMSATVEAGVTWDALHLRLAPLGLRAPAWGTLSGLKATVGGGMSQNGMFWGAREGTAVDAALSFDVVLADGTVLTTGNPTLRPHGPDLTGLFAADCGALGVKARVTLRLVPIPEDRATGTFSLPDGPALFAALSAVARAGLASESFAFDPVLQAQRMKRESLGSDAKALGRVMKAQGSAWKALKAGAKVVAAGRSFLDDVPFSLHTIAEARQQAGAEADLAAIRRIVADAGGREVENTIPTVLAAHPFPPPNSMVGPAGERWVPVHGIVPHVRLPAAWDALHALYADHAQAMARLGVEAGAMFAGVSPQAALLEPVFFWPDALNPLHRASVEPAHLARLKGFPESEEARALVHRLRGDVIRILGEHGAAHLQIARTYPLKASHDPAGWALLTAVKRQLDPRGLMNPGSLGL